MLLDPLSHLTLWNPLRGLDHPTLTMRLEEGERGDYARLQWTYRAIERSDATARAIKAKLRGALRALDWKIKTPANLPPDREAEAAAQAQTLQTAYDRVSNLREAIAHLALADFRGYAHCNKIYRGAVVGSGVSPLRRGPRADGQAGRWDVVELRPVPQWHFSRGGYETPWTYDPAARFGSAMGTPLTPRHWITHEVDDPASEIFAACHVQASAADYDWHRFLDTYSNPAIFIEGPPNMPPDREPEYVAAAEAIGADGRGFIPYGASIHSVSVPPGHGNVFVQRLGYLQKLMVLAGTGGLLSMLAEPTGIGKGASDLHDDTWLTIAAGVATNVSETMQRQFDRPELEREYGTGCEALAYFELSKPDKEDMNGISATVQNLSAAGYQVDPAELSEKLGYTLTLRGAGQ